MGRETYPHGFIMVPNELLGSADHPGPTAHLPHGAVKVYLLVAQRYRHDTGKGSYESQKSMARRLGMSRPALRAHLQGLLKARLIRRIPHGERRHKLYIYEPILPVPPGEEGVSGETNRQKSFPKIGNKFTRNRKLSFSVETEEAMSQQEDTRESRPPIRVLNRDNKSMSIDERIRVMKTNPTSHKMSSLVQTAWQYWKHCWERHYHRPCYAASDPTNKTVVPRDKKNLRHLIEQEGFVEVIDRMERCFEVCDQLFPCVQNGKFLQPITLNNFVHRRFHDQWIRPPNRDHVLGRRAATMEEKLAQFEQQTKPASKTQPSETDDPEVNT